jgi:hypothetical protein
MVEIHHGEAPNMGWSVVSKYGVLGVYIEVDYFRFLMIFEPVLLR